MDALITGLGKVGTRVRVDADKAKWHAVVQLGRGTCGRETLRLACEAASDNHLLSVRTSPLTSLSLHRCFMSEPVKSLAVLEN
jgi:hypothetical protein